MAEAGVVIARAAPASMAGIGALRDRDGLLAALRAAYGVELPTSPGFVQAGDVTFACLAPARFLASADRGADLAARLASQLEGLAAVTDQSDMWAVWTLSGHAVREALARLVPIDTDPETFRIGHLALTRQGHIDLRLRRTGQTRYEIATTTSFATDLQQALQASHP